MINSSDIQLSKTQACLGDPLYSSTNFDQRFCPGSERPGYLFILPWSLQHLGGVNQVVINLAREMQQSGSFDPIVLVTDWTATEPVWESIHGINTVRWRVRPYRPGMGFKEKLAYHVWIYAFYRAFQRFCDKYRIAVVNPHFPGYESFTIFRILRDLSLDIPKIISFHGSDLHNIIQLPQAVKTEWYSFFLNSHAVVTCSSDLGRKFNAIFGEKITPHTVHNGLDSSFITSSTYSYIRELPKGRIILNVAKFDEVKGQDVLINAFANIANTYNDVHLVLVGATGKELPALKAACVREGVDGFTHFFSDVPHEGVADFFKAATIFALPSRREAFPLAILEAGAFGLPVVASRVGGIPEILTDGETGYLVTPDDPAELVLRLRFLLDNPVGACAMGERLCQNILKNFTWTASHNKYLKLIRSCNETIALTDNYIQRGYSNDMSDCDNS